MKILVADDDRVVRCIVVAKLSGLDDYIIKPFSPNELAARVRTVLWRANRRSAT